MNVELLKLFLGWCTIINAALLVLTTLMVALAGGWIHGMHSKFHRISRESFNIAMYYMVGIFKLLFIVFNLVPYIVLVMIT